MKTVVILAHPELKNSIANKRIIEKLKTRVPKIEIRDIFSLYPDYIIDVESEQSALLKADTVIFQYPFLWYNMPAILKHWFDSVFAYNFAFGSKGDKLKNKNFLLSFTIGGTQESYSPLGSNHFRIEEFLKPMEQTAYMAQMIFLKPIYQYGMTYRPGGNNTRNDVETRADKQALQILNIVEEQESGQA